MKRALLAVVAATAVGLVGVVPASAQEWTWDLGIYGGGSWFSASLDEDQLGEDVESLRYKIGWQVGPQLTWWPHSRVGIRAHGGYAERAMEQGETDPITEDHNHWDITGDLMFRLKPVPDEFMGREFLPYLALGAGLKIIDPAEDTPLEGDETGVIFGVDSRLFNSQLVIDEENKFQALVALGGDWRFRPNMALRLELGDRIWDHNVHFAVPTGGGAFRREPPGDENIGNWVHQIYGNVGLQFLFGVDEVERVVVTPPPAPPAPEPPAPPPPAERPISVCVIDPTAPGGMRIVQATYMIEARDTLVQGRPIGQVVTPVPLATEADWYIAGRPLTLEFEPGTIEFVTYGGARAIGADELEFLGTVNGLPVYAAEDAVEDILADLRELREAEGTNDLEDILDERQDLRGEFEDLQVVYVPLQTVGCVFQGLNVVEQVRKVRGD